MIYIILLGLIAGYRETIHLCDRGSWSYPMFRNWFWFTNQADKRVSNWDSFHVSSGVFTLITMYALYAQPEFMFYLFNQFWTIIVHIVLAWVVFFYARNIMMHVVLPLKPDFRYLIPLVGTWIKKQKG